MIFTPEGVGVDGQSRHEIKFVAPPAALSLLHGWVRTSVAAFKEVYAPRWVNNIYFDNIDLDTYEENLSGISDRLKVRFRWYGAGLTPENGTMEVKRRRNNLGAKLAIKTEGKLDLGSRKWRDIIHDLKTRLPPDDRLWLITYDCPTIINRYWRQYFESTDKSFRLTIDTEQSVFDQTRYARPNLTRKSNHPDSVVVELKFGPPAYRQVARAIGDIPLRRSRNSKYMTAVASTFYKY